MTTHEYIDSVAKTLRAGTKESYVKLAIMNDRKCSEAKAMTIIAWAKQWMRARKPIKEVGSCI